MVYLLLALVMLGGISLGLLLGLAVRESIFYSKHKCLPCPKDCCVNPKKVDTAAGCQTDPVKKDDDNDRPMGTCCGGNCT